MHTQQSESAIVILAVDAMSCGHCVDGVTRALRGVSGVRVISVTVGRAEIELADPAATGRAIQALHEAGYPAREMAGARPATKSGCSCCGGRRGG